MYILRRHIEDGCKQFDPNRAIGGHVPCTWPWLLQQAQEMPPHQILTADSTKATLSQYCVLCGQHLQRSGAIIPHIQNDHASTLTKATQAHPDLIHTLKSEAHCHCHHTVKYADHQCPVHVQILILRHVGAPALPGLPPPSAADFTAIWEDSALRAKLTHTCAHCNANCGLQHLHEHLHTHTEVLQTAAPLMHLAQSPFMDCCEMCLQAQTLPDECPVALNICIFAISHGLRFPLTDRGGPHGRNGRELGKPPERQEETNASGASGSGSTTAGHSSTSPIGTEARVTTAGLGHGGPVHPLPASRSSRDTTTPLPGHQAVERPADKAAVDHGTSYPSMASPDSRTGGTTGQSAEGQTSGRAMARTSQSSCPHELRGVELHAVQSPTNAADCHRAQTDPYGYDETVDSGTPRTGAELITDLALQSPEEAEHQPTSQCHLPVAPTGDWPSEQTVGVTQQSQSLRHLALAVLPPETSPVSIQPLGRDPGPALARPIEASAAARACLTLRLQNDGVACYVNANFSAFVWGMLQRRNADWSDFEWGEQAFHTLLTDGLYNAIAMDTAGFEDLVGHWGPLHRQEDAHEFTHAMLQWCKPDCVDLTWSRRFIDKGLVTTYDTGSRDMPPTLTLGKGEKGSCSLQQLIDSWSRHSGMKTCFHFSTSLMCLHLDRLTRNDSGAVCRAVQHGGLRLTRKL